LFGSVKKGYNKIQRMTKSFQALLIAALLITSISIYYVSYSEINKNQTDLKMLMTAALIIRNGDASNLYNLEVQKEYQQSLIGKSSELGGVLPFRILPIAALPYMPFTTVSFQTAYLIIYILNLLFILCILSVSVKLFNITKLAALGQLVFIPVIATVITGQNSFVMLAIYCVLFFALSKRNFGLLGVLACLLFLKPQHVLLIPFILLIAQPNKKALFRFIAGLSAGTIILFVLNTAIYKDITFIFDYSKFILNTEYSIYGSSPEYNHSLLAVVHLTARIFNTQNMNLVLYTAAIGIPIYLLALANLRKHKNKPVDFLFGISVIFTIIINLHITATDASVLVIPIMILTKYFKFSYKIPLLAWILFMPLPMLGLGGFAWIFALGALFIAFYLLRMNLADNITSEKTTNQAILSQ